MIISHKYKFIFIKTVKTAGTSIEIFLSPHCGDEDTVTPIYPHVEPHSARNYQGIWNPIPELIEGKSRNFKSLFKQLKDRNKFYNHISASKVKKRISNHTWNNYFKFCVERNPWDKTLSHYHMLKQRAGGNLSIEDYFRKGTFCINYPKYTNSKGNVIVDQVVKYEQLTDELTQIFNKLSIPFKGNLGVKAKSEYRKDRRPYQEIFSNYHKKVIEDIFSKEISLHGY